MECSWQCDFVSEVGIHSLVESTVRSTRNSSKANVTDRPLKRQCSQSLIMGPMTSAIASAISIPL